MHNNQGMWRAEQRVPSPADAPPRPAAPAACSCHRDSGVSGGGVGMSATSNPGAVEGGTAAQSDSPKSLLMSAPSQQPSALSSMGSGSAIASLSTYSLSMDEDVDEEMQQLGSSSSSDGGRGVATMPPSWRKTPMVTSSNGSKQAQQHQPPGSVVNDIVPLKSKVPGSSAAAAAEPRQLQQAEQSAKVH